MILKKQIKINLAAFVLLLTLLFALMGYSYGKLYSYRKHFESPTYEGRPLPDDEIKNIAMNFRM